MVDYDSDAVCRPHPEERVCAIRSANASVRTRVSKDEDEPLSAPSCFETHRSVRRLWRCLRACRAAPQHEGEGARGWSVQISLTAKWPAGPCGTARPRVVWPLDLKLPARRIPSTSHPAHGKDLHERIFLPPRLY